MYTQCPDCLTFFLVEAHELAAANGHVRCSHCQHVFSALLRLTAELPAEPPEELPVHAMSNIPPALSAPLYRPEPASNQGQLFVAPEPAVPARAPTPRFMRHAQQESIPGQRAAAWWAACGVLAVVLLAQIAWAERARWAGHAHARATLQRVCALLGCEPPQYHDLTQLQLVSRDIRPHPSVADALVIGATLRNNADLAQGFPVLQVTLSDLDEQRIAMRRFQPHEYIHDRSVRSLGLAPGGNATIALEVADPGRNAIAFEFAFLPRQP